MQLRQTITPKGMINLFGVGLPGLRLVGLMFSKHEQ